VKGWLRATHKEMGIYIPGHESGETVSGGNIIVDPLIGYVITPRSRTMPEEPVKLFYYKGGTHVTLNSIVRMFGRRQVSSFLCDDYLSGAIPTSILCPGGIVRGLEFSNPPVRMATSYLTFEAK